MTFSLILYTEASEYRSREAHQICPNRHKHTGTLLLHAVILVLCVLWTQDNPAFCSWTLPVTDLRCAIGGAVGDSDRLSVPGHLGYLSIGAGNIRIRIEEAVDVAFYVCGCGLRLHNLLRSLRMLLHTLHLLLHFSQSLFRPGRFPFRGLQRSFHLIFYPVAVIVQSGTAVKIPHVYVTDDRAEEAGAHVLVEIDDESGNEPAEGALKVQDGRCSAAQIVCLIGGVADGERVVWEGP